MIPHSIPEEGPSSLQKRKYWRKYYMWLMQYNCGVWGNCIENKIKSARINKGNRKNTQFTAIARIMTINQNNREIHY